MSAETVPVIVSRHHEIREVFRYDPHDVSRAFNLPAPPKQPGLYVCMDCGRTEEGLRWSEPCRPKLEAASSGYAGPTIAEYMRLHFADPIANPRPIGLLAAREGDA